MIWLLSMFRYENLSALANSLKRRLRNWSFLEMAMELDHFYFDGKQISFSPYTIEKYRSELDRSFINFLNSIGNLGWWNSKRLAREIISKVENPFEDIYLISYQGNIIASSVLHKELDIGKGSEIGFVAVSHMYRGGGIGEKLLSHILIHCSCRGTRRVWLRTDSFRLPAIRVYFKIGFKPVIGNSSEIHRWNTIRHIE